MLLKFVRNDFARVKTAINMLSNNKIPNWVIVVYYITVLPIGLLLIPLVLLFNQLYIRYIIWKLGRL